MADTNLTAGGSGTYQEGNAFAAVNTIKQLKAKLDNGDIDYATYVKQAQPIADFIGSEALRLGAGGSAPAKVGQQLWQSFTTSGTGFNRDPNSGDIVISHLKAPSSIVNKELQALIPGDLTDQQKQNLIASINPDMAIGSDEYKIQQEALRQAAQAYRSQNQASAERKTNLGTLRDSLTKQADEAYNANSPAILDDLNARGLLGSSAVGKSLAQERTRQLQLTDALVAQQSLADSGADINSVLDIGATQRAFQTSGLQRDFSSSDNARAFQQALALSNLTKPSGGGKGGGGGALSGAATGATVGASFGPWGALAGAGLGAYGGYRATR